MVYFKKKPRKFVKNRCNNGSFHNQNITISSGSCPMVLFFFACPSESFSELLLLSLELVLDRLLDVLELAFCCLLKVGKTPFGFSDALQFREAKIKR